VLLGIGMGLFTPPNNSAIMGSAPKEKLGVAGGVLNMTRSLGLIFGVNISGVIFTSLEHRYLMEKGYTNVQHIFSNSGIPVPIKDNAFMHGFLMVIMVLLVINVLSAFLSAAGRAKKVAIIDHEASGTVVISSGFFNGFSQEAKGLALFVMLLLFTGFVGAIASSRLRSEGPLMPETVQTSAIYADKCPPGQGQALQDAKKLALAYYATKYHDTDVSVDVRPIGHHMEADISKNGVLIKELTLRGNTITEHRSGVRDWVFELLNNVS
jgi:hypothetical protein